MGAPITTDSARVMAVRTGDKEASPNKIIARKQTSTTTRATENRKPAVFGLKLLRTCETSLTERPALSSAPSKTLSVMLVRILVASASAAKLGSVIPKKRNTVTPIASTMITVTGLPRSEKETERPGAACGETILK